MDMLYTNSDDMLDILETVCIKEVSIHDIFDLVLYMTWVFCKFQICGNDCGIPTQTLTDKEDEQNSVVLRTVGQLRKLRGQLLLLDNHCTTDNNNNNNNNSNTKIMEMLHHLYCVTLSKVNSTSLFSK